MVGFLVGTVCLVGLVGLSRGGRRCGHGGWHHHPGHWEDGPRGGRRGWRGAQRRGAMGRAMGEVFKRRLHVDEDQEGIVDHALADLRETLTGFGEVLRDSRGELAKAFAGDEVDEAAIASVWARHDEELATTRREAVSALKQIHAVLDPEQRATAAEWLGAVEPPRWA